MTDAELKQRATEIIAKNIRGRDGGSNSAMDPVFRSDLTGVVADLLAFVAAWKGPGALDEGERQPTQPDARPMLTEWRFQGHGTGQWKCYDRTIGSVAGTIQQEGRGSSFRWTLYDVGERATGEAPKFEDAAKAFREAFDRHYDRASSLPEDAAAPPQPRDGEVRNELARVLELFAADHDGPRDLDGAIDAILCAIGDPRSTCPLSEYECGDSRCNVHHRECNQDGSQCWHNKVQPVPAGNERATCCDIGRERIALRDGKWCLWPLAGDPAIPPSTWRALPVPACPFCGASLVAPEPQPEFSDEEIGQIARVAWPPGTGSHARYDTAPCTIVHAVEADVRAVLAGREDEISVNTEARPVFVAAVKREAAEIRARRKAPCNEVSAHAFNLGGTMDRRPFVEIPPTFQGIAAHLDDPVMVRALLAALCNERDRRRNEVSGNGDVGEVLLALSEAIGHTRSYTAKWTEPEEIASAARAIERLQRARGAVEQLAGERDDWKRSAMEARDCLADALDKARRQLAGHERAAASEEPHRARLSELTIDMHDDPPFILQRAVILIERLRADLARRDALVAYLTR